jgi:hypothetical protein
MSDLVSGLFSNRNWNQSLGGRLEIRFPAALFSLPLRSQGHIFLSAVQLLTVDYYNKPFPGETDFAFSKELGSRQGTGNKAKLKDSVEGRAVGQFRGKVQFQVFKIIQSLIVSFRLFLLRSEAHYKITKQYKNF